MAQLFFALNSATFASTDYPNLRDVHGSAQITPSDEVNYPIPVGPKGSNEFLERANNLLLSPSSRVKRAMAPSQRALVGFGYA